MGVAATLAPNGLLYQNPTKKWAHWLTSWVNRYMKKIIFKMFEPEPPPLSYTINETGIILCEEPVFKNYLQNVMLLQPVTCWVSRTRAEVRLIKNLSIVYKSPFRCDSILTNVLYITLVLTFQGSFLTFQGSFVTFQGSFLTFQDRFNFAL